MKSLSYYRLLLITALLALFLPVVSLAQTVLGAPEPAAPGAPAGPAWVTALLQYVAAPLIPIVGGLIIAVLTKLATFLHAKESNSKVAGAFAVAVDYIETAFSHVRAGMDPKVQAALADGVIDGKERQDLKKEFLDLVLKELPGGILGTLSKTLGGGLMTWLSGKAEQEIDAAAAPKAANPPTA